MAIKRTDINKAGKLTHMVADDLFYGSNTKQVFSAKTGKWLGTIQQGQELNFEPQDEPEQQPEPEIKNPNQLDLFS